MTKAEFIEKYGEEAFKRYLAYHREYGRKYYQEHKEKLCKRYVGYAMRNYKETRRTGLPKCVRCIETGEIFENSVEASRSLELNKRAVANAIHRNCTAGGYHWEYLDE